MNLKQENMLLKLAYMGSFEELSRWVEINSNFKNYIANPSAASDTDRMVCLFHVQEPLIKAHSGNNERKNGRDLKLIKAIKIGDYASIADVLASTAWTYWADHGFLIKSKDAQKNLALISLIKNQEINKEKNELQKSQIEKIGAILDLKKAKKKGSFQVAFDFLETDLILKYIDFDNS